MRFPYVLGLLQCQFVDSAILEEVLAMLPVPQHRHNRSNLRLQSFYILYGTALSGRLSKVAPCSRHQVCALHCTVAKVERLA